MSLFFIEIIKLFNNITNRKVHCIHKFSELHDIMFPVIKKKLEIMKTTTFYKSDEFYFEFSFDKLGPDVGLSYQYVNNIYGIKTFEICYSDWRTIAIDNNLIQIKTYL